MLKSYHAKRDFSTTREPATGQPGEGNLRFVVQKHRARRLHYDVRLEIDGVLKSWPVPKGPSLDPDEKRLAVMVEDHPLDYGTYEGVIADGNYGAGEVIVWDAGSYSPDEDGRLSFGARQEANERMRAGLDAGKLSFTLKGRKLRGSWTLVKTSRGPNDWLLIKHRDEYADAGRDVLEEDRSVQSGLTVEELKAGQLPDPSLWSGQTATLPSRLRALGREAPFPAKIKPMLARLTDRPFSNSEWLFEPKLDGHRVLAFVQRGAVTLRSRSGIDVTAKFSGVAADLASQPEEQLVIDGEVVALNADGLPDFGLLQASAGQNGPHRSARPGSYADIRYYPFDLLYLNGTVLDRVPLVERKRLMSRVLVPTDTVLPVEYVETEGARFFAAAVELGLEGMVAKRARSEYEPGARSDSWLKIKATQSQELVVGGYTPGSGARAGSFGALLVGYHDDDNGLRYAGRVGTGFDDAALGELRRALDGMAGIDSPFRPDPELDRLEARFVRPEMVVRVRFSQWTADARLRAPVFETVVSDVDPSATVRERAEAPPPSEEPVEGKFDVRQVLDQIDGAGERLLLDVGSHQVALTNLNKEIWPGAEGWRPITKGEMIRYYARMGPVLLPHLRDRPFTLTRYPNGIGGKSFYQKHWEHDLPGFVETVTLYSSSNEGDQEYLLCNNLPTLLWLAQLADIELHPWMSRTVREPDAADLTTDFTGSRESIDGSTLNYPDFIVFDLDPYIYSGREGAGEEPELNRKAFRKVREVAFELKDILDQLSLSSFVKTSGKTGLHIYVPVLRQYTYKVTRKTCELVGRFLVRGRPQDVTTEWSVSKRAGKIFLDYNQNVRGKNMASIYSLRPLPGAPASTPVRWDELAGVYPTDFTIDTVPDRVAEIGDLWSGIFDAKHDLQRLLEENE